MLAQNLKDRLAITDLPFILTDLGCEEIKTHTNYTTATRSSSADNPCGVVIYHQKFDALMPTTAEFERYPVKDIITVVQVLKECSLPQAIHYLCSLLNIPDGDSLIVQEPILSWLEQMNSPIPTVTPSKEISPLFLKHFFPYLHHVWFEENITSTIAERFKIGYDISTNAITIPIFDEIGKLCGVQCRNLSEEATNKYYYLYPCVKQNVLYGFYQNYQSIRSKNEIIIFEGAKSVLQAASVGINNCVALLGKNISSKQIDILNREGFKVILALDNDVQLDYIKELERKINNPLKFNQVFTLRDDLGLYLSEKQSPSDNLEMLKAYNRLIYPVDFIK